MAKPITTMPALPQIADPQLQQWAQGIHDVVSGLQAATLAPNAPSDLRVTPIAGGNVVQFTRSNAQSYTLYAGSSPDQSTATQVTLGTSNTYTENLGTPGTLRYYWVVGLSQSGTPSTLLGPKSGTTLALGTPAAPLPTVAASYAQVYDTTIGRNRPVIATTDPTVAGQPTPST